MRTTPKNIIVTGAGGFLGRYVVRTLAEKGFQVHGIDTIPIENTPQMHLTEYYRLRLPSLELGKIFQKNEFSAIIHCAGRASVQDSMNDPIDDFHSSPVLVFEILNTLRLKAPECRFLLFSSAAVYGNPQTLPVTEAHPSEPISPYGFHKRQCELICREFSKIYGLKTAVLRIFSAYGPGLRRQVMWDMCQNMFLKKSLIQHGTGDESRDFVHALDIAQAVLVLLEKGDFSGQILNLGSGIETQIRDLAHLICRKGNTQLLPQFNGINPKGNPQNWRADISQLTDLGWAPKIPLEEGVTAFVNWCRAEMMCL